jgi:D-alanyl-D-alanine-carboxypeptidase/D-alanyl-D-alanine-endopeptidase
MKKELVSKKIIALRRKNGLSQEQLSNNSGVALRTVQRIEAGSVSAHLQTLTLLAKALNIEVSELTISQGPSSNVSIRTSLLLLHLSPIIGSVFPLGNVLLPIALWLYKRTESIEFNNHGRSIVNFQLTILIIYIASFVMIIMHTWSYAVYILYVSIVLNLVLILLNSWRIWKGKTYDYMLSIPFLKLTNDTYLKC